MLQNDQGSYNETMWAKLNCIGSSLKICQESLMAELKYYVDRYGINETKITLLAPSGLFVDVCYSKLVLCEHATV